LAAKTVFPSSSDCLAFFASSKRAVFSLFPLASFSKRGIALSID
jgi:hypothetical protein